MTTSSHYFSSHLTEQQQSVCSGAAAAEQSLQPGQAFAAVDESAPSGAVLQLSHHWKWRRQWAAAGAAADAAHRLLELLECQCAELPLQQLSGTAALLDESADGDGPRSAAAAPDDAGALGPAGAGNHHHHNLSVCKQSLCYVISHLPSPLPPFPPHYRYRLHLHSFFPLLLLVRLDLAPSSLSLLPSFFSSSTFLLLFKASLCTHTLSFFFLLY